MNIEKLYQVIIKRKREMPEKSYVASLFRASEDRIIQKIGEETTEVVIAAKNTDKKRLVEETADLWFHMLILLASKNISFEEIFEELKKRQK